MAGGSEVGGGMTSGAGVSGEGSEGVTTWSVGVGDEAGSDQAWLWESSDKAGLEAELVVDEAVVSSPLTVSGVDEEVTSGEVGSGSEEVEVEVPVSSDKAGLEEETEDGFPIGSGMTEFKAGSEEASGEESVEVAVEVASVKDSP